MLRGISARQFQEWRAYNDLEPFDEERADIRTASIVQAIYNVRRGKGQPPIKLMDCVVRFGADATESHVSPEQARAQTIKTMEMLTMLFGAEPETPKPRVRRER